MKPNRDKLLISLHRGVARCRKCRLCEGRTHAVPGEGPSDAEIMFIGEAPGENEDLEGKPFRGRSGRFLDDILKSSGMRREKVYITSSVKCRPPRNRDPKPDELETCRKAWLEKQIDILKPELIVLLGKVALRQLLGETGPLQKFHGRIIMKSGRKVLPTYHPAAAMRFPEIAVKMRSDLDLIGQKT